MRKVKHIIVSWMAFANTGFADHGYIPDYLLVKFNSTTKER